MAAPILQRLLSRFTPYSFAFALCIAVVIAAAVSAEYLDWEPGTAVALLFAGAALIALGGESIAARRDALSGEDSGVVYFGAAAQIRGACWVLCGVLLAVAAFASLGHAQDSVLQFLKQRPGFGLLPAGVLLSGFGAGKFGRWRFEDGRKPGLLDKIGAWISGAFLLLLGMALTAAGAFEIVLPAVFDAAIDSFLGSFPQPPALS